MEELLRKILNKFGLEYFGKYYGIYKGFVADVNDPENLGRLKLSVPSVYGDGKVLDYWAYPKGMYAGKDYGAFIIPEKGDAVWVQFEGGNSRFPVWEHGWFAQGETPKDASPSVKIFKTPSGFQMVFDDAKNGMQIGKEGTVINFNNSTKTIEILAGQFTIKGAQAIQNVSGAFTCIPICPYAGLQHAVDTAITTNM